VGGAALVAVSSALHGVVPSVAPLVAVRILGGIGEAAFFVGAGTMVTDLAPEARRGEAISYWSVSVYGGLAFGPLLGELVLGDASGPGAADADFGRVWALGAVLAGVSALLALGTRETLSPERRAAALASPAPLIHRRAIAPGLVLFLGMVPFAGFATFVPLYVEEIDLGDSSGAFLVYGVVVLAVRLLGARVPDRIGPLASGTIATATIAGGMLVVALLRSAVGLYLGTAVFALGMAFLYPAMLMLGLTGVPEEERSSAVGTVSTFFDLSQGVGAALLGAVVALGGYRGAFVGGAVLSVAALALLRSGADPRVRAPVDHEAFEEARAHVEPEPP
jgi:MFS family permease